MEKLVVTVNELRSILIGSGRYTEEEALAIKGKANLEKAIHAIENDNLDDVEFEEIEQGDDVEEVNESEPPAIPMYCDDEWPEYAMSFFNDSELVNGKPTCVGLRRVAELLLGEIFYSKPMDCNSGEGLAWVRWEVAFYWKMGIPNHFDFTRQDLPLRTFGACADANFNNTMYPYNNHLTAVADTRAEARCLRKALKLAVISAEETEEEDNEQNESMKSTQQIMITRSCDRLNISANDVYQVLGLTEPLSYTNAAVAIRTLREYEEKPETIPEEIKKD